MRLHNVTNIPGEEDIDPKTIEKLIPPELPMLSIDLIANAMKTLNMLGILWAGRGSVKKSFLYLLAANNFYENNISKKLKR